MKRRSLSIALVLIVALPWPACAAAITLPLVYAGCPGDAGGPTRIDIGEVAKGTTVVYRRAGRDPGPFETLDVNLAKISRRLFFTLRTTRGLVEFQGRATDDRLVGLLSDETGASRTISLAAVRNGTLEPCSLLPDSPR